MELLLAAAHHQQQRQAQQQQRQQHQWTRHSINPTRSRASRAEIGGCAGVGVGGLLDNNEGQVLSRQCPNPEKHFFLPTILLSIFYAPLHLIFSSSFLFFLCFLCAVLSFSLSFAFAPHTLYIFSWPERPVCLLRLSDCLVAGQPQLFFGPSGHALVK